MRRIKTASDLKLFLEALAKESTIKAKSTLKEELEQEIEYVSRGLENAKKNQSGYSQKTSLLLKMLKKKTQILIFLKIWVLTLQKKSLKTKQL